MNLKRMKLNLRNPIVFFDLETTGTSILHDRIVEISMLKIDTSNEQEIKTLRINPGVPIPLESSLIHGIYDDEIANSPSFNQVGKNIYDFLKGCDLAGFNVVKFDIPVLVEEFLRTNIDFDISKKKIVDAQRIFHLMEKRNLSSAYQFYCNKDLTDAHSAEADTVATYEVLLAQIEKYDQSNVTDLQGNLVGKIANDITILNELTNYNLFDVAGRMVLDKTGVVVFNFGKYKGQPVSKVLLQEPQYYDWMMKNDFALDTKRKLTKLKLENELGKK